jgi:hypothetical protein
MLVPFRSGDHNNGLVERRCKMYSVTLSIEDIAKIVKNAGFDQLIGETESHVLDAKGQPYQFHGSNDRKWELAKDVSAFANASGGYILIGLASEQSPAQAAERISALRPISKASFDPDRHLKLLSEWLHPSPK